MALILTDLHLDVCQPCPQNHTDLSEKSRSLPGKPDYPGLKLLGVNSIWAPCRLLGQ